MGILCQCLATPSLLVGALTNLSPPWALALAVVVNSVAPALHELMRLRGSCLCSSCVTVGFEFRIHPTTRLQSKLWLCLYRTEQNYKKAALMVRLDKAKQQ